MPGTYDLNVATGGRAILQYKKETDWGIQASSGTGWRSMRMLGGGGMDQRLALYRSAQMSGNRIKNATVRGSQHPAGSFPFELAPRGWIPFLWHLLGGSVVTTGSGPYTHTIKGSTSLPVGFTLEEGFTDMDAAVYWAALGCRVARMNLACAIDQIPTGTFDILAREVAASTATSLNSGSVPALATDDPFTSVQIAVSSSVTGGTIATCQSANLTVDNGFYEDRGYALGNDKRIFLKPGERTVMVDGTFWFADSDLYDAALAGTVGTFVMAFSDGTNSVTITLPKGQFLPNNTKPKATDDGPISIPAQFEAKYDSTEGTDIKIVIVSAEADITT